MTYPLFMRSSAIATALEVADELLALEPCNSDANRIATTNHVSAIIELAMVAAEQLASELEALQDRANMEMAESEIRPTTQAKAPTH